MDVHCLRVSQGQPLQSEASRRGGSPQVQLHLPILPQGPEHGRPQAEPLQEGAQYVHFDEANHHHGDRGGTETMIKLDLFFDRVYYIAEI